MEWRVVGAAERVALRRERKLLAREGGPLDFYRRRRGQSPSRAQREQPLARAQAPRSLLRWAPHGRYHRGHDHAVRGASARAGGRERHDQPRARDHRADDAAGVPPPESGPFRVHRGPDSSRRTSTRPCCATCRPICKSSPRSRTPSAGARRARSSRWSGAISTSTPARCA
jgi:hypothetical protein